MIGELDDATDEAVDLSTIRAEPLPPIRWWRRKKRKRKRHRALLIWQHRSRGRHTTQPTIALGRHHNVTQNRWRGIPKWWSLLLRLGLGLVPDCNMMRCIGNRIERRVWVVLWNVWFFLVVSVEGRVACNINSCRSSTHLSDITFQIQSSGDTFG